MDLFGSQICLDRRSRGIYVIGAVQWRIYQGAPKELGSAT